MMSMRFLYYVAAFFQPSQFTNLPNVNSTSALQRLISTALAVFGAVTFLVIVIAGFRYVTSSGDPQALGKAKNMIIYASIGLVVSMVAFTITAFVVNHV